MTQEQLLTPHGELLITLLLSYGPYIGMIMPVATSFLLPLTNLVFKVEIWVTFLKSSKRNPQDIFDVVSLPLYGNFQHQFFRLTVLWLKIFFGFKVTKSSPFFFKIGRQRWTSPSILKEANGMHSPFGVSWKSKNWCWWQTQLIGSYPLLK